MLASGDFEIVFEKELENVKSARKCFQKPNSVQLFEKEFGKNENVLAPLMMKLMECDGSFFCFLPRSKACSRKWVLLALKSKTPYPHAITRLEKRNEYKDLWAVALSMDGTLFPQLPVDLQPIFELICLAILSPISFPRAILYLRTCGNKVHTDVNCVYAVPNDEKYLNDEKYPGSALATNGARDEKYAKSAPASNNDHEKERKSDVKDNTQSAVEWLWRVAVERDRYLVRPMLERCGLSDRAKRETVIESVMKCPQVMDQSLLPFCDAATIEHALQHAPSATLLATSGNLKRQLFCQSFRTNAYALAFAPSYANEEERKCIMEAYYRTPPAERADLRRFTIKHAAVAGIHASSGVDQVIQKLTALNDEHKDIVRTYVCVVPADFDDPVSVALLWNHFDHVIHLLPKMKMNRESITARIGPLFASLEFLLVTGPPVHVADVAPSIVSSSPQ